MKSYQSKKRRRRGAQAGNLNADGVKKFTALAMKEKEGGLAWADGEAIAEEITRLTNKSGLKMEIAMLRFVMIRLMAKMQEVESLEEMMQFSKATGMIGERLAEMLVAEKKLGTREDMINKEIAQAAERVLAEKRREREAGGRTGS